MLTSKQGEREFDIDHAEKLFKYQQKKGFSDWEIASNQKFEFKDGVISPTGKAADTEPGKQGSTKGSR